MSETTAGRWVIEHVNDDQGFRTALLAQGDVHTADSVQNLALFNNATFGRVMILDGAIQVTTADEFIYHEMMAHVPLFAHGAAKEVLIIGGGDGGIAREVLRHQGVEAVTLVEIDQAVVDLAREHLPQVSDGAFDSPRLKLVITDGAAFVAQTDKQFDVIIVDSPDPVGAGKVLFEPHFYQACFQALRDDGILVTQSGMPFLTPDWFQRHAVQLNDVFPARAFYLTTVPSYTGGPMAHGFSAKTARHDVSVETLSARSAAIAGDLKYWTPALHRAAFALPRYIETLCGTAPPSR
ncbi:MAG: polyamine aminopropyltransferase [Pseudomonadota bacterium]